ncbi:hypothetical protein ACE01N_20615 [Saccharicrinis sp. FJH2]|uniref:hypothetical protein n=1 Tax=Saccharicrinis sp. FJH65 TaxID=3344659 RepID=UPI0035F360A2
MSKKWIIIISAITLLSLTLTFLFFNFTRETAEWDYIQNVGGIKTDTPLETEDGYYLPILCNVSGLDSITVNPTTLNSAISCIKTKVTINKNYIYLKIVTGIATNKNKDCKCKAVSIGDLESGEYKVYYGDVGNLEHEIGTFTVKQLRE